MTDKKCIKCNETKILKRFDFRKDTGKYRNVCHDCKNTQTRKRRNFNKEQTNAKNREYRVKNTDKVRAYVRKSYNKNKHKYKERLKKWRKDNKEYMAKYYQVYKITNADKIQEYENSLKRKQQRKKYMYIYEKERLSNDSLYRLQKNLRARLRSALHNNYKTGSAVRDLGCSISEFKAHLESQFQSGMTWNNYGRDGWHIDHIRPLTSFDLTDSKQIKQACHYTNLQPLWAEENLSKGASF